MRVSAPRIACASRLGRHQRIQARPRLRTALPRAAPDEEIMELDVVTYTLPSSGALGLAAVEKLRGGRAALSPLRLERDSGLWVEACHGSATSVDAPLSSLRRVDALYAQRAVADRVENPHGEHAENTWELLAQLPPGVLSDLDLPT